MVYCALNDLRGPPTERRCRQDMHRMSSVLAETKSLIARMSTPPSSERSASINSLIGALKDGGVWDKLSVLQVHAAADEQVASLNWVGDYANASPVGGPAFTPDKGWRTDGASSYVDTNWLPSSDTVFLQDDAMFGVWSNVGATLTGTYLIGAWGPATERRSAALSLNGLAPNAPSITRLINRSSATGSWSSSPGGWGNGLLAVSCTAGNTEKFHSQGVARASRSSVPSVGRPPLEPYMGVINYAGTYTQYGAICNGAFFAGAHLTDQEHAVLNSAMELYMAEIGNVVTPLVGWGDSLSNNSWYAGASRQSDDTGRAFRRYVSKGVSGESSSSIAARMLADTLYHDSVQVIWCGRNDINNSTQVVNSAAILSAIADMVAAAEARSGKYIVLGVTTGNQNGPGGGATISNSEAIGTTIGDAVASLNATLASTYGSRFLDILGELVAAGALGDANDQADAAAGIPPRSHMADHIHFVFPNADPTRGATFIGRKIEIKLQDLGY